MQDPKFFDLVIIGGGASGTALLYTLSRYTNIGRIALVEKYASLGSVNSNAKNNSQTLHIGEIETNYTIEKAKQVYPGAMMVRRYVEGLPAEAQEGLMQPVQKMVLAVGDKEVPILKKRFPELKKVYTELQELDAAGIAAVEPEVMKGRKTDEPVLALFNPHGYAVNFGKLTASFAAEAQKQTDKNVELLLNCEVKEIIRTEKGYDLKTDTGILSAHSVVVDTDAYSLGFAKSLGYGKEFSLIPIAGSFYFSAERLRGKVYRVQTPGMPFAAVHGDPDLTIGKSTRWGPTARFYPVLEARKFKTMAAFFAASGLQLPKTWLSFIIILLDPTRFWYLLKNFFYDLPYIGKRLLLPELQKIVPTLQASDLRPAKGYGGMRLQRVDTNSHELLLGEGKILGDNIIFNMTPSPGASVSLYNAMRDAETIATFSSDYVFDKQRMLDELSIEQEPLALNDPSLRGSYAS
jgi:malate dehydrogenase (quinone)